MTACALAACGRRGPLEPPPGSMPPPRAQATLVDPLAPSGPPPSGLSRNTAEGVPVNEGVVAPPPPPTVPRQPFVLDPLL